MLFSMAVPIFAEEEKFFADLDRSSVTEDLSQIYSLSQFAYNKADKGVYLINVTEMGATRSGMENHALYLYFYNPSSKSFRDSSFNQVEMAVSFDDTGEPSNFKKQSLSFVSASADLVLLKYKLNKPYGDVSSDYTKRRYALSGVELQESSGYDVHEYSCAKLYEFSGFGEGIAVKTRNILAVSLEVHQVSYLSGDSGKDAPISGAYSNQVNSVYFSVPNRLMEEYGELYAVDYEYYHYRTAPILVVNATDSELRSLLNENVGKKDLPFTLYSGASGDGTIMIHNNIGPKLTNSLFAHYTYFGKSVLYDYYTSVFSAPDIEDRECVLVSADELQRYFKNYNKSNFSGTAVGSAGYNADLFDLNASQGYKRIEVTIEDDFSLPSYADSKNNNFWMNFLTCKWDYAFNVDKYDNSLNGVKYIEKLSSSSFQSGAADTLRVDESYLDDMEDFQAAEASKGNTTYLLRYACSDDYYCVTMFSKGADADGNVLMVQENVYLDFDIITLSFRSKVKDGESVPIITTIPTVSDPSDGFTDIKNEEPDHDLIDDGFEWLRTVLGIALGILLVIVISEVFSFFGKMESKPPTDGREDKW